MNGKIQDDETPEERLAAVARSLVIKMAENYRKTGVGPAEPDKADYRDALRPFLKIELLRARIDEARKTSATALTIRMQELDRELRFAELEAKKTKLP